jgi:hypothetical protein
MGVRSSSALGLRLRGAVLVAISALGCGSAQETETEAIGRHESPIWNGTNVTASPSGIHHEATVKLRIRNYQPATGPLVVATCTGTLLRNNIVLTAKHCLRTGDNDSTQTSLSNLFVYNRYSTQAPPNCSQPNCAPVAEVEVHPSTDVALLVLSRGLAISGSQYGHTIPIHRNRPELYDDHVIQCSGYGANARDAVGPTGTGTLRWGWQEFFGMDSARTVLNMRGWGDPYQLTYAGDSGGPCWSIVRNAAVNAVTYPPSAFGVVSGGVDCVGGNPCFSSHVAPLVYRDWARFEVDAHRPNWDTDYNSPHTKTTAPYDGWVVDDPNVLGHCTSTWQQFDGFFVQGSNCQGGYPEGTLFVHRAAVIDGALISTGVQSPDDDAAGIVFRYIDDLHYYLFMVDAQQGHARIYKRRPLGFVLLASTSGTVDWSAGVALAVHAEDDFLGGIITGYGLVVSAFDSEYPEGKVGLYTRALTNAFFYDGLNINYFGPGGGHEWPPFWE